jgi:IS30 family transposase
MGQKYDHLSYEDRVKIEHWHKNGKSIRYIAGELGRSPNTISYELKHLTVSGEYIARKASVKAYQKRYYARTSSNKVARDKALRHYVDESLDKGWSPGEIAGSSDCPCFKTDYLPVRHAVRTPAQALLQGQTKATQGNVPSWAHR